MTTDVLAALKAQQHAQKIAVRQVISEAGREDVLREFDKNMWDIETGVMQARNVWHSISPVQRRVLIALYEGRTLRRASWSKSQFEAVGMRTKGTDAMGVICSMPTVKNLVARGLLDCEGGPDDPMRQLQISTKGNFVVRRGQITAATWPTPPPT